MANAATVIGGGLAGCEAAWQLAAAGVDVTLVEMKPAERSPAHRRDDLAELVCSNSLRSAQLLNAVGLLKEEMRRLGSLVMRAALATRVPAGDALAVDRERFSALITAALAEHPRVTRQLGRVDRLPEAGAGPVIIATGPLTAPGLAESIVAVTGRSRLYFYDAIAPIVSGSSIDTGVAFAASRYGKGDGADYLNCPLDEAAYDRFVSALTAAECMPLHPFEAPRFFPGCLPVEVVAASGRDSLRFGTMKPVGLTLPGTDEKPFAVVQLRREDADGQAYNLVGFQTKLLQPEQRKVFRLIPGLERAEFLRYGAVHRNTYLDAPELLDDQMRLRPLPHLRFAGQLTGVEGYVESAAHGLLTGLLLARELTATPLPLPSAETALGALAAHVLGRSRLPGRPHEPQNLHWGLFPPPAPGTKRTEVPRARALRAVAALERWAATHDVPLVAATEIPQTRKNLAWERGRRR